ncbi:hypothetical protein TNCV_2191511 [Trichonephila clavipes]|nr:hypothetical protein TNCV_2191511 [Trichonephila clavipes]
MLLVHSDGLEVTDPLRKLKIGVSTPSEVNRFSGCENCAHACRTIMWQAKHHLSLNSALVLKSKLNHG